MTPEQFLELTRPIPESMMLITGDGELLAANRSARKILGGGELSQDSLLADFVIDPPDKIDRYLRSCSRSRAMIVGALTFGTNDEDARDFRCEGAVIRPRTTDSPPLLIMRCVPKKAADQQFMALNQKIEQLTRESARRQRVNEALRESEEKVRLLIESAPESILIVDSKGIITLANVQVENMFGFTREELLGQSIEMLIPTGARGNHEKHRKGYMAAPHTREMGKELDLYGQRKDGSVFPVNVGLSYFQSRGETFVVSFITDITEARQRIAEIVRSNQAQEVLNALLQLSMEPISLEEKLERAFDMIIAIPWLSTLPKGSIFLVEGDTEELVLKVERGLGTALLKKCARVPFGRCLCGLAAAEGKSIHASCVDHLHEYSFDDMEEHGHYNVPILLEDKVAGVINLYLEEGHERDDQEIAFLEAVANTLAGLIKRQRLERVIQETLIRRGQQVRLSTEVAQVVAEATDLKDLYERVVYQIKERFSYYHTQLLTHNTALDTMALVVGYGETGQQMLAMQHSMPMGVGLVGTAAATGQSMLRPDVSADPDWFPNPLLPDTKGELAVPIKLGDKVLGVLDVQSDAVGLLDEEDQLLLEGLCGQIAVAIESTRLRQDMEGQLRELRLLHRQMSREGWDKYQQQQDKVGYSFDLTGVQVLTTHPDGVINGKQNGEVPQSETISHLSKPLTVRGEPIGSFGIEEDPERPLTDEEREIIDALTQELAEALEAARLFEQTQIALSEQERLASELETVAQVSTAASTILEVDELLQSVVDLAKSSFGLYHAHVYLINETGKKLVLKAGAGNIGRLMSLEGREINIDDDSIVARAARTHKGVLENNVRRILDFMPHPLLPETRSEMALPMLVGGKLIGVLDLQSDEEDYFTQKDLNVQTTLAAQIAVAVENATQYAAQVQTSAKLREVDVLKTEFLASMSHELRTPLNSIIGFADVLLEGLDGELNERMEEDVRLIRESGSHLRGLIGDILDMSKIEAGRMDLRYEEVDLCQLANDVLETAAPLAQEKKLFLHLDIDEDVKPVMADRTRVRQVMWNILGNAVKFTEKGSITISVQAQPNHVLCSIRDTGIGIKEENMAAVFEQFRQIDGGLNRAAGGTGLGMPITKKLVELHGGDIWVESVYGQGSTFLFTIPYEPPKAMLHTAEVASNSA